jgi:magnesium-transporting ATPase (P-type)
MLDPPHLEVSDAIARCRSAGIRVVMMTGDYGLTAESIARRVGLVTAPGVRIINGSDLDSLDDATLERVFDDDVLFARVAPEHKLRVVEALQRRGDIVAVTGDGVNDAPALKKADIGVAMGRIGTDVAKEAADMVLLDDNFASIVNAVEEGRSVYANIKKFAGYIFTSNTPEAVPFIVFALSGGQIPLALGVMHILAIDLGTDLVPALALGVEPPEPGGMERPPRRRDEHLVSKGMLLRSYGWLGPLQSLAVMAAFFFVYWTAGYAGQWFSLPDSGTLYQSATALALAAVVTTQIGNLFAHRTERHSIATVGWTTNRLVFTGIATELAVIAAIVYLPPLQALVGTMPFPAWQWLVVLAVAPLLLIADEARKALVRHSARSPS